MKSLVSLLRRLVVRWLVVRRLMLRRFTLQRFKLRRFTLRRVALPLLACLPLMLLSPVNAGEIALTFDDAPRPAGHYFSSAQRSQHLLEALRQAEVKEALFFVTTRNLTHDNRPQLLAYAAAGHRLGNHSHGHDRPDPLGPGGFRADLKLADANLRELPGFVPLFRFPFLDEGKTAESHQDLLKALTESGYRNGYVTVDNYDWFLDEQFQQALKTGKSIDYARLKQIYIDLLWRGIQFYDRIARQQLGRSPRHVLLLHENDLAALFVADLVRHIRTQGWSIISATQAYQDAIAEHIPDTVFNGQGRVGAIAAANGVKRRELVPDLEDEDWLQKYLLDQAVFK